MLHIGAMSPPLADIGADFVLSVDSKELRRAGLMPQIFEKNGPFIWGDTLHYSCCAFWEMRREGNRDKDMELLYFLPAVNGFLLHEGKFIFGPLLAVVCVCVCVWLNTTHISFHICSCYRYSEEERSYWMAVDVLLQQCTHVSVCAPLSPACRAGFYKSGLGNVECSKCPPHSFSHYEGSLHCGCEKNYFRAEGDPASMACTREYTCHWRSVFVCRFKELSDDSGSSLTWTDPSHIWQEKPSSESRELWEDFLLIIPKNMHGNLVLSVLLRILTDVFVFILDHFVFSQIS